MVHVSKGAGTKRQSKDTEAEIRGKEASVGVDRRVEGNPGRRGRNRCALVRGLIRPAYQQDFYSICSCASQESYTKSETHRV